MLIVTVAAGFAHRTRPGLLNVLTTYLNTSSTWR